MPTPTTPNRLEALGPAPVRMPFLTGSLVHDGCWFVMDGETTLTAFSVDQLGERFSIELPGRGSHCHLVRVGQALVLNRYLDDNAYTVLAYSCLDGGELWRARVPVDLKSRSESGLFVIQGRVVVVVEGNVCVLDPTDGSLIHHHVFSSRLRNSKAGESCLFVRPPRELGRIGLDGTYSVIDQVSVLDLQVSNGRLFCLDRKQRSITVYDAGSSELLYSFDPREITGGWCGKSRRLMPIPNAPDLLVVLGEGRRVAFAFEMETGRVRWRMSLSSRHVRPDGFAPSELRFGAGLLAIELYSVGSDTEVVLMCNPETGDVGWDSEMNQCLPEADRILIRRGKTSTVYRGVCGEAKTGGYVQIERLGG